MYPNIDKFNTDKPANQTGFTLIELLISLVILSIGMLGMAGMQLSGLRNSATSSYRTDATQLSYDIVDSMRANRMAVAANVFEDIDLAYSDTLVDPELSCLQATTTSTVASCSANEMAAADLYNWITRVRQKLPNASVSVQCNDLDTTDGDDCTEFSTHTIMLSWDENVDGDVDTSSFSYTFRP